MRFFYYRGGDVFGWALLVEARRSGWIQIGSVIRHRQVVVFCTKSAAGYHSQDLDLDPASWNHSCPMYAYIRYR